MKGLAEFLRILTGSIFVLSGTVKAIDIRGFAFKMEEYFSPAVFDMPFFEKIALPLSIFVVLLEVIFGFFLIFKIKLKKSLYLLVALCIFFAFLTFYSAYYNKVTDCGCFGDAVKFTPWQSFFKDIALLVLLLFLVVQYPKIKWVSGKAKLLQILSLMGISAVVFVLLYGMLREPLIDFRDYPIGTDLNAEKQKIDKDPSVFTTVYTLKNKKTGEEKQVDTDTYTQNDVYWKEGTDWELLSDKTRSELLKQGYKSEVAKFQLTDSKGNDLTAEILQSPHVALLFSYAPEKLSPYAIQKTEKLLVQKYPQITLYGVSPDTKTYKFLKNLQMDATAIKTIARSNPFVLVLEKGVIIDKYPAKDLD